VDIAKVEEAARSAADAAPVAVAVAEVICGSATCAAVATGLKLGQPLPNQHQR
jgi:hypothetical protein